MTKTKATKKLNAAHKAWITRRAKANALRERALRAWATRKMNMQTKTTCCSSTTSCTKGNKSK